MKNCGNSTIGIFYIFLYIIDLFRRNLPFLFKYPSSANIEIRDFRHTPLCKAISLVLIATFIAYDISWAYPDSNVRAPGIVNAPDPERREMGRLEWYLDWLIRSSRIDIARLQGTFNEQKEGIAVYFDRKQPAKGDSYLVPCAIQGRSYQAHISHDGVIGVYKDEETKGRPILKDVPTAVPSGDAYRRGISQAAGNAIRLASLDYVREECTWHPVDRGAFELARALGLTEIPLPDTSSQLREYRDTIGAKVPAPVIAHSAIFPFELRFWAEDHPDASCVIMPRIFFADSRIVERHLRSLQDSETASMRASSSGSSMEDGGVPRKQQGRQPPTGTTGAGRPLRGQSLSEAPTEGETGGRQSPSGTATRGEPRERQSPPGTPTEGETGGRQSTSGAEPARRSRQTAEPTEEELQQRRIDARVNKLIVELQRAGTVRDRLMIMGALTRLRGITERNRVAIVEAISRVDVERPQDKIAIINTLANIKISQAAIAICGRLSDANRNVRRAAIQALGNFGSIEFRAERHQELIYALVGAVTKALEDAGIPRERARIGLARGDEHDARELHIIFDDDVSEVARAKFEAALNHIYTSEGLDIETEVDENDPYHLSVTLLLNVKNLTAGYNVLGTHDVPISEEGNYRARTQEELTRKAIVEWAQSLLEGLRIKGLSEGDPEYDYFYRYVYGPREDGLPSIRQIVDDPETYGNVPAILTEDEDSLELIGQELRGFIRDTLHRQDEAVAITVDRVDRISVDFRDASMPLAEREEAVEFLRKKLKQLGLAPKDPLNPDHGITKDAGLTHVEANLKIYVTYNDLVRLGELNPYFEHYLPTGPDVAVFLARAASSIYMTTFLLRELALRPISAHMFTLSRDIIGHELYFKIHEFIVRRKNEVEPTIRDREYDFHAEIERPILAYIQSLYETDPQARAIMDTVYMQVEEAGLFEGLGEDRTLLIVDECGWGTYPMLFKFIVERRSREAGHEVRVQYFTGTNNFLNQQCPKMYAERINRDFHISMGEEIVRATTVMAEDMPQPIAVARGKAPLLTTEVPFRLAKSTVLLGAHLRNLLLLNGIFDYNHRIAPNALRTVIVDNREELPLRLEAVRILAGLGTAEAHETLLAAFRGATEPRVIKALANCLRRIDRDKGRELSSRSNAYAAYRFGEDAFYATAAAAYARRKASVVQVTADQYLMGDTFLKNMGNMAERDVALLPKWERDIWRKVRGSVLVLDSPRRGTPVQTAGGVTHEATVARVIDFARQHLSDPAEETVNIIVSDRFRFSLNDPGIQGLVEDPDTDPGLRAFLSVGADGRAQGFRDDMDTNVFIAGLIDHFLRKKEGVQSAGSPLCTNLHSLVDSDVISPVAEEVLRSVHVVTRTASRKNEDSFVIASGDVSAGVSDLAAYTAGGLSRMRARCSLYGVQGGLGDLSGDQDIARTRILIGETAANPMIGTSSTAFKSSITDAFEVDGETGMPRRPESVVRVVHNVTGYTVRYTGDVQQGCRGFVLDERVAQPTYSKFRGIIITGGTVEMAYAQRLYELVQALGIRTKKRDKAGSRIVFQVIAVPASIEANLPFQAMGYHSASSFAQSAFRGYVAEARDRGMIRRAIIAGHTGRDTGYLAVDTARAVRDSIVVVPERVASAVSLVAKVREVTRRTNRMPALVVPDIMRISRDDPLIARLRSENPYIDARLAAAAQDEAGTLAVSGAGEIVAALVTAFCGVRRGRVERYDIGLALQGLPADEYDVAMARKYAAKVREACEQGLTGVAVAFENSQNPSEEGHQPRIVQIADLSSPRTMSDEGLERAGVVSDASAEGLLVDMRENDPDPLIRDAAGYALGRVASTQGPVGGERSSTSGSAEDKTDLLHRTETPMRIAVVVSRSLEGYAELMYEGFAELSSGYPHVTVDTFAPSESESVSDFAEKIRSKKYDVCIVQLQGADWEEPVAFEDFGGKTIFVVHRPQEVLLRHPEDRLRQRLRAADGVVLLGSAMAEDYKKLFGVTVHAIPHGFFGVPKGVEAKDLSIAAVGSITTWSGMRQARDVLGLMKEIRNAAPEAKVIGYIAGTFVPYEHPVTRETIDELMGLRSDPDCLVLSAGEIERAYHSSGSKDITWFKQWLYERSDNGTRTVIVDGAFTDKALQALQLSLIDFNVQMYREIINGFAPKIEYSREVHRGPGKSIPVVFDSPSMVNIAKNEGQSMVIVPFAAGSVDFRKAAQEIVALTKEPGRYLAMCEENLRSAQQLTMRTVAERYLYLAGEAMSAVRGSPPGTPTDGESGERQSTSGEPSEGASEIARPSLFSARDWHRLWWSAGDYRTLDEARKAILRSKEVLRYAAVTPAPSVMDLRALVKTGNVEVGFVKCDEGWLIFKGLRGGVVIPIRQSDVKMHSHPKRIVKETGRARDTYMYPDPKEEEAARRKGEVEFIISDRGLCAYGGAFERPILATWNELSRVSRPIEELEAYFLERQSRGEAEGQGRQSPPGTPTDGESGERQSSSAGSEVEDGALPDDEQERQPPGTPAEGETGKRQPPVETTRAGRPLREQSSSGSNVEDGASRGKEQGRQSTSGNVIPDKEVRRRLGELTQAIQREAGGKVIREFSLAAIPGFFGPRRETRLLRNISREVRRGHPVALNLAGFHIDPNVKYLGYDAINDRIEMLAEYLGWKFEGYFPGSKRIDPRVAIEIGFAEFALRELLKNALTHGNRLNTDVPLFLFLDLQGRRIVAYDGGLDTVGWQIDPFDLECARLARLFGERKGISSIRDFCDLEFTREDIPGADTKETIGQRAIVTWPSGAGVRASTTGSVSAGEADAFTSDEGGAIGQYAVVDANYDERRGALVARVIDRQDPERKEKQIRIRAARAPPQEISESLQRLMTMTRHTGAHDIIADIVGWYGTFPMRTFLGRRGVTLVLQEERRDIQGLGSRHIVALSRRLLNNPVALFHEIAHSYIIAHPEKLAQIESLLTQGRVQWVRSKDPSQRVHYALRAFQRQFFGEEDRYLTELVSGREEERAARGEEFGLLGDDRIRIEQLVPLAKALEEAIRRIDREDARDIARGGIGVDMGRYGQRHPGEHMLDIELTDESGERVANVRVRPLRMRDGTFDKKAVFLEWFKIMPDWARQQRLCGPALYRALLNLLSDLGYTKVYGLRSIGSWNFWERMMWRRSQDTVYSRVEGLEVYRDIPQGVAGAFSPVTILFEGEISYSDEFPWTPSGYGLRRGQVRSSTTGIEVPGEAEVAQEAGKVHSLDAKPAFGESWKNGKRLIARSFGAFIAIAMSAVAQPAFAQKQGAAQAGNAALSLLQLIGSYPFITIIILMHCMLMVLLKPLNAMLGEKYKRNLDRYLGMFEENESTLVIRIFSVIAGFFIMPLIGFSVAYAVYENVPTDVSISIALFAPFIGLIAGYYALSAAAYITGVFVFYAHVIDRLFNFNVHRFIVRYLYPMMKKVDYYAAHQDWDMLIKLGNRAFYRLIMLYRDSYPRELAEAALRESARRNWDTLWPSLQVEYHIAFGEWDKLVEMGEPAIRRLLEIRWKDETALRDHARQTLTELAFRHWGDMQESPRLSEATMRAVAQILEEEGFTDTKCLKGSAATGMLRRDSDIDIVLVGSSQTHPKYLMRGWSAQNAAIRIMKLTGRTIDLSSNTMQGVQYQIKIGRPHVWLPSASSEDPGARASTTGAEADSALSAIEKILSAKRGYASSVPEISTAAAMDEAAVTDAVSDLEGSGRVVRIEPDAMSAFNAWSHKASIDYPFYTQAYRFGDTAGPRFAVPLQDLSDELAIAPGQCIVVADTVYIVIRNIYPGVLLVLNCRTREREALKLHPRKREVEFLRGARHKNITNVYRIIPDEANGDVISMKYYGPVTFSRYIDMLRQQGTPLSEYLEDAVRKVIDAGEGFMYMRSIGYAFGDFHPSQVLIDEETGEAVLSDFGGVIEAPASTANTTSLARLLCYALTQNYYYGYMPNPRTINPKVPDELARIVMKADSFTTGEKYSHVGEVVADLKAFIEARRGASTTAEGERGSSSDSTMEDGGLPGEQQGRQPPEGAPTPGDTRERQSTSGTPAVSARSKRAFEKLAARVEWIVEKILDSPKVLKEIIEDEADLGFYLPAPVGELVSVIHGLPLVKGMKALELGSGDGRIALLFALMGFETTGVEARESLIAVSEKAEDAVRHLLRDSPAVPRVRWEGGTFFDHDFSSYDLIYYFDRSTHDQARLFAEVAGRMKPGAFLIVHRQTGEPYTIEGLELYKTFPLGVFAGDSEKELVTYVYRKPEVQLSGSQDLVRGSTTGALRSFLGKALIQAVGGVLISGILANPFFTSSTGPLVIAQEPAAASVAETQPSRPASRTPRERLVQLSGIGAAWHDKKYNGVHGEWTWGHTGHLAMRDWGSDYREKKGSVPNPLESLKALYRKAAEHGVGNVRIMPLMTKNWEEMLLSPTDPSSEFYGDVDRLLNDALATPNVKLWISIFDYRLGREHPEWFDTPENLAAIAQHIMAHEVTLPQGIMLAEPVTLSDGTVLRAKTPIPQGAKVKVADHPAVRVWEAMNEPVYAETECKIPAEKVERLVIELTKALQKANPAKAVTIGEGRPNALKRWLPYLREGIDIPSFHLYPDKMNVKLSALRAEALVNPTTGNPWKGPIVIGEYGLQLGETVEDAMDLAIERGFGILFWRANSTKETGEAEERKSPRVWPFSFSEYKKGIEQVSARRSTSGEEARYLSQEVEVRAKSELDTDTAFRSTPQTATVASAVMLAAGGFLTYFFSNSFIGTLISSVATMALFGLFYSHAIRTSRALDLITAEPTRAGPAFLKAWSDRRPIATALRGYTPGLKGHLGPADRFLTDLHEAIHHYFALLEASRFVPVIHTVMVETIVITVSAILLLTGVGAPVAVWWDRPVELVPGRVIEEETGRGEWIPQGDLVDIDREMPEGVLKAFLQFMREKGVECVVAGGVVRDTMLGGPIEDIDVALMFDVPERELTGPLDREGFFRIWLHARDAEKALAERLGVPRHVLWKKRLKFCGYTVDFMGGHYVVNGRVVGDTNDARICYIGLDTHGRVYDPYDGRRDLTERSLRFAGEERTFGNIVRMLRFAHQYGMAVHPSAAATIERSRDEFRLARKIVDRFQDIVRVAGQAAHSILKGDASSFRYRIGRLLSTVLDATGRASMGPSTDALETLAKRALNEDALLADIDRYRLGVHYNSRGVDLQRIVREMRHSDSTATGSGSRSTEEDRRGSTPRSDSGSRSAEEDQRGSTSGTMSIPLTLSARRLDDLEMDKLDKKSFVEMTHGEAAEYREGYQEYLWTGGVACCLVVTFFDKRRRTGGMVHLGMEQDMGSAIDEVLDKLGGDKQDIEAKVMIARNWDNLVTIEYAQEVQSRIETGRGIETSVYVVEVAGDPFGRTPHVIAMSLKNGEIVASNSRPKSSPRPDIPQDASRRSTSGREFEDKESVFREIAECEFILKEETDAADRLADDRKIEALRRLAHMGERYKYRYQEDIPKLVINVIVIALDDPSDWVRKEAVCALGAHDSPRVAEALMDVMRRKSSSRYVKGTWEVAEVKDEALERLIVTAKRTNDPVLRESIRAFLWQEVFLSPWQPKYYGAYSRDLPSFLRKKPEDIAKVIRRQEPRHSTSGFADARRILDLERIEASLRAVKDSFAQINAQLAVNRAPLTASDVDFMMAGYRYLNTLIVAGRALSWSDLRHINNLILWGEESMRSAGSARHIGEEHAPLLADEEFASGLLQGLRAMLGVMSPIEWAAGIYTRLASSPHSFEEGNHRVASLAIASFLMAEGLPPFVLTVENAVGYFHLSTMIERIDRSVFPGSLRILAATEFFRKFLARNLSDRFVSVQPPGGVSRASPSGTATEGQPHERQSTSGRYDETAFRDSARLIEEAQPAPDRVSYDFSAFPDDFSGTFTSGDGERFSVSWDVGGERFILKPIDGSLYDKASSYPAATEEGVAIAREETGEAVRGTIRFLRFVRTAAAPSSGARAEALSTLEYMTLSSLEGSRDIIKAVARSRSPADKIIPRTVAINVDMLPLAREGDDSLLETFADIVVLKERRLNARFNANPIRFEFVSLSGEREGLRQRLEEMYRTRSTLSRNSLREEDLEEPRPGFLITTVADGRTYGDYRVLAIDDRQRQEGEEDVYPWASILDLAIVMTLLIDSPARDDFYPMVKGLYEKLLQRRLDEGELNLDVILGLDPVKSQELTKRLKIPPVARCNYNELREFYERMKDVLVAA